MPDDEKDVTIDTPNDEEVTTEETTEEVDEEKETLREENKKLFARAKKAEGFVLENGEWVKKPKVERQEPQEERSGLSDKDLLFLARTDIHEDNLDELKDWAKFKKISMSEAYQQLKPKFDTDAEIRKSAEVTTTGSRRAPTGKISDEAFLKKMQNEIPEPGSADAERLFEIRHRK